MDDVYNNIDNYNPSRKRKIWKLNISFVFITQSYFSVPKVRLNSTHNLIMKIYNKRVTEYCY